jgi:hypothetical protein
MMTLTLLGHAVSLASLFACLLTGQARAAGPTPEDTALAPAAAATATTAEASDAIPASGQGEAPGRSEASEKRMQELAEELRRIADEHGPDAVVLLTKLLIHAGTAGAVGPTEVRVLGPSAAAPELLALEVDSGLFFDPRRADADNRHDKLWQTLIGKSLTEMQSFQISPAGLELTVRYSVQTLDRADGTTIDPTEPAETEVLVFRLDDALLRRIEAERPSVEELATWVRPALPEPGIPAASP